MKLKTMQVTVFIILILSLVTVQVYSQTELWRATWDFSVGQPPNLYMSKDVGKEIIFDSAGNIYVLVFDDYIGWAVFKYDTDGNKLWHYNASVPAEWISFPCRFQVDAQGYVYVSSTASVSPDYKNNANLIKLNTDGTQAWWKSYDNETYHENDNAVDLEIDPSGNIYLLIRSNHNDVLAYAIWKPVIQKYDANGSLLWEVTGTTGTPNAIETDSNGDLFVLFGSSIRKYSSSTGALLSSGDIEYWWDDNGLESNPTYWKGALCMDLIIDSNDQIYVTAKVNQKNWFWTGSDWDSDLHDNFFTAKLDNNCNVVWRDQYGTYEKDEYPTEIHFDEDGNILVTGPSDEQLATLKYSPDGTRLGTYVYSDKNAYVYYVNKDYGYTIERPYGGPTALYQYLLSTGTEQWNLPLSEELLSFSMLCEDASGKLYLTGSIHDGEVHQPSNNNLADDMVLIKYDPEAEPPPPETGPPTNLVALNGYHNAVPLAWKPPTEGAADVTGYNIYRQSQGGSESKLTGPIKQTYYRDASVSNGVTYTYRISAVTSSGEGDKSSAKSATPVVNGYRVEVGWTNQIPTIDGRISQGEWDASSTATITYPGESSSVTMIMMYDADYLYLAIIDSSDHSLDNSDGIGLFFDENQDREWPSTWDGSEGMIRISLNNKQISSTFSSYKEKWPNTAGNAWTTASGVNASIKLTGGNVQYEARFDLDNSPVNPTLTKGMGWCLYIWEGGSSDFTALWPQEIVNKLEGTWSDYTWAHGPFSYGDILFGEEEEEEEPTDDTIIRMNPASQSINLSQTDTVNIAIENVTELSGFEFTIDYDPAVVQISDASAIVLAKFLGSTGRSVMPLTPTIDNTTGQISYTVASFGSQTCPSGNGILVNITWTAVGEGTSVLDLSGVQITDALGDPISATVIDGEIVVTDTHFADLDSDGDVDIVDIQKVAAHYGSKEGDPDWDSQYDIDGDGDVDIVDVQKVAAWYGEEI